MEPQVAAAIDWWKLDDQEQAEILGVLLRWVPELARRYGLMEQVIPPCWYKHEPLIQELLALYQYRNQQQFLPVAPPSAPLDFHYSFQLAIGRLTYWAALTRCNQRQHNATRIPGWAAAGSTENAEWVIDAEYEVEQMTGYGLELVDEPGRPRQYIAVKPDTGEGEKDR